MSDSVSAVLYKYGQQSEIFIKLPDNEVQDYPPSKFLPYLGKINGFDIHYATYMVESGGHVYVWCDINPAKSRFLITYIDGASYHHFVAHSLIDLSEVVEKIIYLANLAEVHFPD